MYRWAFRYFPPWTGFRFTLDCFLFNSKESLNPAYLFKKWSRASFLMLDMELLLWHRYLQISIALISSRLRDSTIENMSIGVMTSHWLSRNSSSNNCWISWTPIVAIPHTMRSSKSASSTLMSAKSASLLLRSWIVGLSDSMISTEVCGIKYLDKSSASLMLILATFWSLSVKSSLPIWISEPTVLSCYGLPASLKSMDSNLDVPRILMACLILNLRWQMSFNSTGFTFLSSAFRSTTTISGTLWVL